MKNCPMSVSKGNYKNYRKVCPSSYVDPTLFGNQKNTALGKFARNNIDNNNNKSLKNVNNSSQNPFTAISSSFENLRQIFLEESELPAEKVTFETARVMNDLPQYVRPYLCTYRTPGALILSHEEMTRIEKEQKFKGFDELNAEEKKCLENKLLKTEELEQCRILWESLQSDQRCMSDDSKCEELRKFHARHEMFPYGRINNEEEMKILNKLAKAAENKSTWEGQVKERQELMQCWKEEDWRMDAETERLRLAAIGMEEELKARRKKDLMIGLVNQINCRKLEKIKVAEEKFWEGEAARRCFEKANQEELDRMSGGDNNKKCYRQQLDICMLNKVKKKIEDDAVDRAILERVERVRKELEDKTDETKENRRKRIEHQQSISGMLRCNQEIIMTKEMEAEIRRIQRSVDQVDRDFMRREIEDQSNKREIEFKVKQGRDHQLENKRELQAIQATRDRLYFESDLRRLMKEIEKEKGVEGKRHKRMEYGNILRQQMCDNEQLRKEFMSEKYKYGREMAEKECVRRKLIEDEMDKKFTHLREKGVAEQAIKKISHKINEEFKGPKFMK